MKKVDLDMTRARQYLLGRMSDEERSAVEEAYFRDEEMVERIEAAEETLIEDYLDGQLDAGERTAFEQDYLASPQHRTRVDIVRQLRAAASATSVGSVGSVAGAVGATKRAANVVNIGDAVVAAHDARVRRAARERRLQWMALAAAAMLLLALGVVLMLWPSSSAPAPRSAGQRTEPSAPAAPSAAPLTPAGSSASAGSNTPPGSSTASSTPSASGPSGAHGSPGSSSQAAPSQRAVLAVSISPLTVRGAAGAGAGAEARPLVIPAAAGIVSASLEGDAPSARLTQARAIVQTVEGVEVWRGAAATAGDLGTGVLARVDIPADRLRANDYIIMLFGANKAGVEQERYRYALRVRAK